jgi:hypothetical protein
LGAPKLLISAHRLYALPRLPLTPFPLPRADIVLLGLVAGWLCEEGLLWA